MMDHPLVKKALSYATYHHGSQTRKYTGELYINHPIAVAELVSKYVNEPEVIAAALLHDVVEDTGVIEEQIEMVFGSTVAQYVWFLTKPPTYVGDREMRKSLDRARLSLAPAKARLIKLFDVYHNSGSIAEHDPEFWKDFLPETKKLYEAIDARSIIEKYNINESFEGLL